MICKNCGRTLEDGCAFCPSCGTNQRGSSLKISGSKGASGTSAFKKAGSVSDSGFGKMTPPAADGWGAPTGPDPYERRPRTGSDWPTPPAPGYYGEREMGGYAGGPGMGGYAPAPKKKLKWWIPVVSGGAATVLIAVLLIFLLKPGYERPIKDLFSGLMNGDAEKIASVISPDMFDCVGVSETKAVRAVDDFLYDCDGLIADSSLEYEIVKTKQLSETQIYRQYDDTWYSYYFRDDIEDAYDLTVEVTVTVDKESFFFTAYPRIIKTGGEWYIDIFYAEDMGSSFVRYNKDDWKAFRKYCDKYYEREWDAFKDAIEYIF